MIYSLIWLPEVLLGAGLKVAQTPDWQSRGRGSMGTVRGVMCHHTATKTPRNMPSLNLLIAGRRDLPGPLAQLGLARDGTFYLVAAGRANHAGAGQWEGIRTGNSSFIGIEAENDGQHEPWPDVQLEAYQRGVAAILKKLGVGANMCCGHKEYAEPRGRKVDPTLDMALFRREVAAFLSGRTPSAPIPAADTHGRPTLRRGSKGDLVQEVQPLLGVGADGFFGPKTEAALRSFQRKKDLVPDGILGPKSWEALSAAGATATHTAHAAPSALTPPAVPTASVASLVVAFELPEADTPERKPRMNGRKALGPDGKPFAISQGRGFYTIGETTLTKWLRDDQPLLASLSRSVKNVISAMSVVEGGLEAVNSYDDAHLSFGIFQWTAGSGAAEGELAVLLSSFKTLDPTGFKECFGRYGLDAAVAGRKATTGVLSLKDKPLNTSIEKDILRSIEWAYRFWRAGHHLTLRVAQFTLAASRIERFATSQVYGRPLQTWMSSELAIALVLDEHVNRPSHVPGTLQNAIAAIGAKDADPGNWSDADEHHLIEAYLTARDATNMTDSRKRAMRIEGRGTLSESRSSFV